jgi:hypothetical protein
MTNDPKNFSKSPVCAPRFRRVLQPLKSAIRSQIWPTSGRSLPLIQGHISRPLTKTPITKRTVGIARCAGRQITKKPVEKCPQGATNVHSTFTQRTL